VVLSKREKYIVTAGVGLVAVLVVYYILIGPYFDRSAELQTEQRAAQATIVDNSNLLLLQAKKTPDWNVMLKNGLQADYSTAQSRTQQMLQNWARDAEINIENLRSDPVAAQKGSPFQTINFNLEFNTAGDQSMRHIARFLWSIESAALPIRLTDVHFQSAREGTDQLNVKLLVSALYMPPTGNSASTNNNNGGDIFNELEGFQ
jgi:hypothetical protein